MQKARVRIPAWAKKFSDGTCKYLPAYTEGYCTIFQCCCQGLETQGQGLELRGQGLTPALIHIGPMILYVQYEKQYI